MPVRPMNASDREETIFASALALPPAKRAAFLDKACAGDGTLRARLGELLEAHEGGGGFMEAPAAAAPPTATATVPVLERAGDRIGRYKLLEQIGEGGCGVVYVAEQTEPVRRRVALKVIKLGMDTKQVVARFEAERQALALMDHPNIAKVLDAGATETGRPYFVMELVRGVKITDYCDQNNLSTKERLELFIKVCQAVQHAHQKGVIHRDLKPSNILVTVNDGVAVPKVIDFGIAKATQGRLTDRTIYTAFEQFVGTPAYTSPEQAAMTSLDIDTRSDIYSLGVLLYELLTGRTPFEAKELLEAGLDAMRRTICEKEPLKPSTRLSTMVQADLTIVAHHRCAEPPKLIHAVRGDLDWIVMKCLEKKRARRYETANGLAADIQRHLNCEPVVARPPSKFYEFQKTVRRHKFGFAAAATVMAALALGLILSTLEARRAVRAEQEQERLRQMAETKEKNSQQVAQFLTDMLKAAGPSVARGRDVTVLREMLDKTAARVGSEFKDQPEVQGDLWFTLGLTFVDIGDRARATTNYQHAVDSYRKAPGERSAKLARALGALGHTQCFLNDLAHGQTNCQLALDIARQCGDTKTLAACLMDRASSFAGWGLTSEEGVPYAREAAGLYRQLGTNPVSLANCLGFLAGANSGISNYVEAESLAREALALLRDNLEPDHPRVANALLMLGQVQLHAGKLEEAESTFRQCYELYRKIYDKDYPYMPIISRFLALALLRRDKGSEAQAILLQQAENSPSNAIYWGLVGRLTAQLEGWRPATKYFVRARELSPDDPEIWSELVTAELLGGELDEYRQQCHLFLEHLPKVDRTGMTHWWIVTTSLLAAQADDFQRACELVDSNLNRWWARQVKPLADYRRGKFESAIQWTDRQEDDYPPRCAATRYVKAAALARLNQPEAARASWSEAEKLYQNPSDNDYLVNGAWNIPEYLRGEAKSLIDQTPVSSAADK